MWLLSTTILVTEVCLVFLLSLNYGIQDKGKLHADMYVFLCIHIFRYVSICMQTNEKSVVRHWHAEAIRKRKILPAHRTQYLIVFSTYLFHDHHNTLISFSLLRRSGVEWWKTSSFELIYSSQAEVKHCHCNNDCRRVHGRVCVCRWSGL